jgi:hypothetical protein
MIPGRANRLPHGWKKYASSLAPAVLLLACLGVAGCPGYTEPTGPQPQLTRAEQNFNAVWQASQDVLRKYYFNIDRQDRRAGVITTLPLTGKQWFEFWRHDSIGTDAVVESTFQTIRREVQISIRPTKPGADTFTAMVEVNVSRSDGGMPQLTSTSEAMHLFELGGEDRMRQRYLASGGDEEKILKSESAEEEPPSRFVSLGRDKALEVRLSGEISAAAARKMSNPG